MWIWDSEAYRNEDPKLGEIDKFIPFSCAVVKLSDLWD